MTPEEAEAEFWRLNEFHAAAVKTGRREEADALASRMLDLRAIAGPTTHTCRIHVKLPPMDVQFGKPKPKG